MLKPTLFFIGSIIAGVLNIMMKVSCGAYIRTPGTEFTKDPFIFNTIFQPCYPGNNTYVIFFHKVLFSVPYILSILFFIIALILTIKYLFFKNKNTQ